MRPPTRFLYEYYRDSKYAEDVLEYARLHLDILSKYNGVFDSAINMG